MSPLASLSFFLAKFKVLCFFGLETEVRPILMGCFLEPAGRVFFDFWLVWVLIHLLPKFVWTGLESEAEDWETLLPRPRVLGTDFIGEGILVRVSCESDFTSSSGWSNRVSVTVFWRLIAEEWEDTTWLDPEKTLWNFAGGLLPLEVEIGTFSLESVGADFLKGFWLPSTSSAVTKNNFLSLVSCSVFSWDELSFLRK